MLSHRKREGYRRPKPPAPHSLTVQAHVSGNSETVRQHLDQLVDRRLLQGTHDPRGLHVEEQRATADLLDGGLVALEELDLRLDHHGLDLQNGKLLVELSEELFVTLLSFVGCRRDCDASTNVEEGVAVSVLQHPEEAEDAVVVPVRGVAVELDVWPLVGNGHCDRSCLEDVAQELGDVHFIFGLGHDNSFGGRRWMVRHALVNSYTYNTIIGIKKQYVRYD